MLTLATTERAYDWGALRSTNASKVKVVLAEKGVAYEMDRLHPGNLWKKPPEILAKHPLGKVPYLETEADGVIFDSTVINEYLDEKYPEPCLMPTEAKARAHVRMLANFADDAFLVGLLPAIWMPYWAAPEKRDVDAMEVARDKLRHGPLLFLERALAQERAKDGDYLCGEFSLADAAFMAVAMVLQVDEFCLKDFPLCEAYFVKLRARDSYKAINPQTSLDDSAGSA